MRRLLVVIIAAAIPAEAQAAETCGNGVDDAPTNGMTDEGCYPAGSNGVCESPLSCSLAGAVAPKTGALVYGFNPELAPTVPYGPSVTFERIYTSHYSPTYFPGGNADYTHPLVSGAPRVERLRPPPFT